MVQRQLDQMQGGDARREAAGQRRRFSFSHY